MKRTIVTLLLTLAAFLSLGAREYQVRGPQGGISFKVSLPEGFNPETDHCPMVILMHGIFSSKDYNPMPALAKGLARAGIASMAAGRLAQKGSDVPKCMVLVAPESVIKEACQGGKFFNARFDPKDPPEYIRCWGIMKLGREYLLSTQGLEIYETAAAYKGDVLLLHGTKDSIVPMWCSERYKETYGDKAELSKVEGENHTITRRRNEVVRQTVSFFQSHLP